MPHQQTPVFVIAIERAFQEPIRLLDDVSKNVCGCVDA
jgi:hypothetical protein